MIATNLGCTPSASDATIAVPIGEPVVEVIKRCVASGLPFLLEGSHGCGKSESVHEAARQLGIPIIDRDLSLLESSDLAGYPFRHEEDGRSFTKFAPPDFLPKPSQPRGLLLLEELNRSSEATRHSALQILTARRIHDYVLAPGWTPCSTINPRVPGKYFTAPLDAALLSRFVRVTVKADPVHWLAWARGAGGVHTIVTEYISLLHEPFDDAQCLSNPRSWTYVSRLLQAVADLQTMDDAMAAALATSIAGLVGNAHASALMRMLLGTEKPITPKAILEDPAVWLATVRRWRGDGRLDVLSATLRQVLRHLRPQSRASEVMNNAVHLEHLKQFFRELPPDLAAHARAFIADRGYQPMNWPDESSIDTLRSGGRQPHAMLQRLTKVVDAARALHLAEINAANAAGGAT